MKRLSLLMLIALFASTVGYSQGNLVFHENFENPSQADSVNSFGPTGWNVGDALASQGTYSDSANIVPSDTNELITNTIDLSSYSNVQLSFDHICKVAIVVNIAEIFVSTDDGTSWDKVTSSEYNGTSNFSSSGSFDANSYPSLWEVGSATAPDNSWWKNEKFDLSNLIGNQSNVKIKFSLANTSGSTNAENFGWFIDNIKLYAANGEMNPPEISIVDAPVDTVFHEGPFDIEAEITDASGIDTAYAVYDTNNTGDDTVALSHSSGNKYVGSLPGGTVGDVYNYFIYARDKSTVANEARKPADSRDSFEIFDPTPPPSCDTTLTSFPIVENFDTLSDGNDNCGNNNTLNLNTWENSTNDDTDWIPWSGSTPTYNTGPPEDHTTGNGQYLFVKSKDCNNNTAELLSKCIDLSNEAFPVLEFYYYMFGDDVESLEVQAYYGNEWQTIFSVSGEQGDEWKHAKIDLSDFKFVTQLKIIGNTGSDYYGDIAIDDIKIYTPAPEDAGLAAINKPVHPTLSLTGNDINVDIINEGSVDLTSLDVNYKINDGAVQTYSWTGNLPPMDIADSVVIGNEDFNGGENKIKIWTSAPNNTADTLNSNDTLSRDFYVCDGAYSGSYTIGGASADFQNIQQAIDGISICGLSDAVTFNIESGKYIGQYEIPDIPGVSSNNTITFQAQSGDAEDVVLEYNTSNSDSNYVFYLNNATYVNFKNLTVNAGSPQYATAFYLENDANFNLIENCIINATPYNGSSSNAAAINVDGSNDYNTIQNNAITGGSYGLYLNGSALSNTITQNDIQGFHYRGIYAEDQDSLTVSANTIENGPSAEDVYGIHFEGDAVNSVVNGNTLHIHSSGNYTNKGLYFDEVIASNNFPGVVSNNFIHLSKANDGSAYGMHIYENQYINLVYNTVKVDGDDNSSSNALYLDEPGYSPNGQECDFINNNLVHTGNKGMAVEITDDAASNNMINTIDYNNYYAASGNHMSYDGLLRSSITEIQSSTNQDSSSVSADPVFASQDDLHAFASELDSAAKPLAYVSSDIDGDARDANNPDIGADEYTPVADDGALKLFAAPDFVCSGSQADVKVKMQNTGTNDLTSADIQWTVNGTAQNVVNFNGNLSSGADSVISLGSQTFNYDTVYQIKAWIENPNGSVDQNNGNDTIINKFAAGLPAGTYSVGGSSADFDSLAHIEQYLNNYGLCGSVTFELNNGTYEEQIGLQNVDFANAANSITFTSASGDSSDVIVQHESDLLNNYVFGFYNTPNVTVKNMTIKSLNKTYGHAVVFDDGSHNFSLLNNEISGDSTASTSSYMALVYSEPGNAVDSGAVIKNNSIHLGAYGLYIGGNSTLESDMVIENNQLNSNTRGGAYISEVANLQFNNNTVESFINENDFTGVEIVDADNAMISKNKVFAAYGKNAVLLEDVTGKSGNPVTIANNFFSADNTSGAAVYLDEPEFINFYYNSIAKFGSTKESTVYIERGNDLNLVNNVIHNGSGEYAIELDYYSSGPLDTADYNNIFSTGSNLIDNDGTDIASINDWNDIGFGMNSISSNPHFPDFKNLRSKISAMDNAGTPISGITEDIDGEQRDPNNPDIGANEYTSPGLDLAVADVPSPMSGCDLGNENVSVEISNEEINDVTNSFDVSFQIDGDTNIITETVNQPVDSGSSITYNFNTLADLSSNVDSAFEISVWIDYADDIIATNDTMTITVENSMTPDQPVVNDMDIPWNTSATITASSPDFIRWYKNSSDSIPFYKGDSLTTDVLHDTTTYYVDAFNGEEKLVFTDVCQHLNASNGSNDPMYSYLSDDMLEITNVGQIAVDLSGYSVEIHYSSDKMGSLPNITLQPGEVLLLSMDDDESPANNLYALDASYSPSSSTSVGYILKDDGGEIVDVVATNGYSFEPATGVTNKHWSGDIPSSGSHSGVTRVESDNNTASDWVVTTDAQPQTLGDVNPSISAGGVACASNKKPVTVNVTDIPMQNAAVDQVISPDGGCGLDNEQVTVEIYNFGYEEINGNLEAKYSLDGSSNVVSETVTDSISKNDTITFTFNTPVDLFTNVDTTFNLDVWVELQDDTIPSDDSTSVSIFSGASQTAPVVSDISVNYGQQGTFTASSSYDIFWYEDQATTKKIHKGSNYTTPVLYDTTSYYVVAWDLTQDSLTTGYSGSDDYEGVMFDLIPQQDLLIDSFAVNFETTAAREVEVYYADGSSKENKEQPALWTHAGNVMLDNVNSQGNVTHLPIGNIEANAGDTLAIYIRNVNGEELIMDDDSAVTTNSNLDVLSGYGVNGHFGSTDSDKGFNGAVYYSIINSCPSLPVEATADVTNIPGVDAGITKVILPSGGTYINEPFEVKAVLQNFGQDTLTSVDIDWNIDGDAQSTHNWNGMLMPGGGKDTVTISANTALAYGDFNIKAWINNPNDSTDMVNSNDSSAANISTCIDQGTYTIDSTNGDFESFSMAANALNNCGINGPVTFDVASGTYFDQMSLNQIQGASSNDTIVFQSASGNPADVTLYQNDSLASSNNYVINLDGTDYITFRNLTIKAEGPNDGTVITSDNDCHFVTFEGNVIEGIDATSAYSDYLMGIGSIDSAWVIRNNKFEKGGLAIDFYGSYSANAHEMEILNNEMTDQYGGGARVYYMDSLTVDGNNITTNSSASSYIALEINEVTEKLQVLSNNMYSPDSEVLFKVLSSDQSLNDHGLIANNMIYSANTSGAFGNTLIEIKDSDYIDFVFNTAKFDASGSFSPAKVLEVYSSNDATVKNNILASTADAQALYVNSSTNGLVTDYNVYWAPNASQLAYWSGSIDDLSEFQAQSGADQNSMVVDPEFKSSDDLHITNLDLFMAGDTYPGISQDIDGDTRFDDPTIGADEYMPPPNDAGLVKFNALTNPVSVGNNDVYVTLKNTGADTLTSADIAWEVNGVQKTTYNWSGSLPIFQSQDSILIGSHNFVPGGSFIKAWVENPNGNVDTNNVNDTIQKQLIGCDGAMAGTYSVGSTNSDFSSIEQSFDALQYCGVDSAVRLEIDSGQYSGNYSLPAVPGASGSNTVTITSKSGNPDDVVLTHDPQTDTTNYTLQLEGAEYITVSDITIKSTGTNYAVALHIADTASYNTVENNVLEGSVVSDDDEKFAVVFAGTGATNFNTFKNNEIKNGSAGIYIDGTSSIHSHGNIIDSNIIEDYYKYAVYASYTDSVMIRNNHMENGSTNGYVYSMRLYKNEGASEITGNYIRGNSSGSVYGIYALYMGNNSTENATIANNMLVNDNSAGGGYGIYLSFSSHINLYYNTVGINSGNSTCALGVNTSSSKAEPNSLDIRNNNFANLSGGYIYDIDKDAINGNMFTHFDYNNAYTTGNEFGEWGDTDIDNFNHWQNESNVDSNAVNDDPAFVSPTDLHVNASSLNGVADPITTINYDFDGDQRDNTNPDIGADEFDPIPVDMGVVEVIKPERLFAPTDDKFDLAVIVKNYGADTMNTFDVAYSYGGANPVSETFNKTIYPNKEDTVEFSSSISALSGNKLLEIYTDMPNDGKHQNDTLAVDYLGLPTVSPDWYNDMDGNIHFAHDGNKDVWERGMPQGNNIKTTHSGTNAWMTDLDADYPTNIDAYLYTPLFDLSGLKDVTLEFWHSVDVDPGNDGVAVEYSVDGGVSWNTLTDTASGATATNWYNDTIGNIPMWSGRMDWMKSSLKLTQFDNHPTPVQFRFYVYSSSSSAGDGWAIDDFALKLPVYNQDAAVTAVNQPKDTTVTGDLVNVEVQLKNFGVDTLTSFPVSYDVNGNVETETWNGTLYPDSVTTFNFSADYNSPSSDYELQAYTELGNDENHSNDTAKAQITVAKAPVDAGVTEILLPNDTTTQFESTKVRVRIVNFGTDTLTSIPVSYDANGQVENETWSGTLLSGDSVDYTFNTEYNSTAGSYQVCAKTEISGDNDNSNDETCKSVVATNIADQTIFGDITIRPNPADQYTFVDFDDQLTGKLTLSVTNVMGKTLLQESYMLDRTNQSVKIDTKDFPSGIYFVNLENSKGKTTFKLIIKH
ncbi:MAG: right-handed parallel beta-helix repeat-containing protein [Bacteroidales bacterium]